MDRYIGLDAHVSSRTFGVVGRAGSGWATRWWRGVVVADVNLIATLLIAGEQTAAAEAVLAADAVWATPLLWRSEWRNMLAGYLRRGELDLDRGRFRWGCRRPGRPSPARGGDNCPPATPCRGGWSIRRV